jgi:hypothetical protein
MPRIDLKNVALTVRSGNGHSTTIKIGEGNLNYTEKRNVEAVKTRGLLDTVRLGEEEMMDVDFQFVWEHIISSGSEPITLEEALKKNGAASAWTSTSPDPDAPYCVDILLESVSGCSGDPDEDILLAQFHHNDLAHSLHDGTVDCKGVCNFNRAVITRG